ncbi:MAG: VCBS repeat-containing protein [Gammaproteobacteria bacterium]|nr:VCBS repeat-containing protein [Gammaproteobacteria bacterium]
MYCTPGFASIAFQDVTSAAGISGTGASFGASWGDFNGDGLPDLWVGNHYRTPSLYRNNGDGTFTDIVGSVWPGPVRDTHGAAWADFDRDGDQDLIEIVGGANSNHLWRNDSGVFVDVAPQLGADLPGARSRTPLWLDWDRDGYLDLVLTQALGTQTFPLILRNTGSGFVDATSIAGVPYEPTTSAFLSDLTGDGLLDLALLGAGISRFPSSVYDLSSLPSILRPDLSNTTQPVSDATFADFDGDLRTDIFTTRGAGPQQLAVRSNTEIAFTMAANADEKSTSFDASGPVRVAIFPATTAQPVLIGSNSKIPDKVPTPEVSFGSYYIDLDPADSSFQGIPPHVAGVSDGVFIGFDALHSRWTISLSYPASRSTSFVVTSPTSIQNAQAIGYPATPYYPLPDYYIRTDSGFSDQTSQSGLAFGFPCFSVVSGDFDNDMDVDIFAACTLGVSNLPNVLLENLGNGTFSIVTNAGGASGSQIGSSESVVTADYNEDGALDLFVTNGNGGAPFNNGPQQLFRNLGNNNHWVEVDLIGNNSDAGVIGSRVYLTAGGKTQLREQNGGMHTYSQNHQRLHFGLAGNTLIDQIEVVWPDGLSNTLTNVAANQIVSIARDSDGDGVPDNSDNCPTVANKFQGNLDHDGEGDVCEAPEANGYWLDFDNPGTVVHIYGLYFHPTLTQVLINGVPTADVSFLNAAHLVAAVPAGQQIGSITVNTPYGSDNTPTTATFVNRGSGLIYDTELDITWLQDANYASTSGFDTDGLMTWPMAMSWAAGLSYYDSIRNKTWTDWRLPSALNRDGSGPCFDLDCINSEMGHLYYLSGIKQASSGPFINHKISTYWSGTARTPLPGTGWLFAFGLGKQDFTGPLEELLTSYAWAVRDGDVVGGDTPGVEDDASVTGPILLDSGSSVTIRTAPGETLSNILVGAASGGPSGFSFPFGTISYTTTSPLGGSVNPTLSFSNDLPANVTLFKVNNQGIYTRLPTTLWTQIDARTLAITLTDGDPVTDLDATANGSIDDPIAVGIATPSVASNTGSGGGGGGCVLSTVTGKDPTLPMLVLLSLASVFFRGYMRNWRCKTSRKDWQP